MFFLIDISFILASAIAFSVILVLLAFSLIFAQKRLISQEDVSIVVNGDEANSILTKAGASLLTTLSSAGIFLPSACGGGGTCAMCKCTVKSGGGDILPTELGHISRKKAAEGQRLACQVKVRDSMDIEIPEEIFGIKKWECEVVSNYNVASFIKEFVVKLPEGETLDFESGGYIQIDVPEITAAFKDMDIVAHPEHHDDPDKFVSEWETFKMRGLKMVNPEAQFRAYSMANHPAEGNIVMLNIRIATPPFKFNQVNGKREWAGYQDINPGICSSYVFSRKPGDKVTISGPYGEFFIKDTKNEMVYIGGGAGMAPLRSHLFHLFHTMKTTDRKVSFWYGGRTKRELFYVDQFREIEKNFPNFRFYIALDNPLPEDNWQIKADIDAPGDGFKGFIMPVLEKEYLSKHSEPEEIEYYFCGPPMMNQSVITTLDRLGVPKENIMFDDFGG